MMDDAETRAFVGLRSAPSIQAATRLNLVNVEIRLA